MTVIGPPVIEHSLNVNSAVKPIQQKRRRFSKEKVQAVRHETKKLVMADFVEEARYPQWLANVVMVKKARWQVVDVCRLHLSQQGVP
ncbi:hypothetical protein HRI_003231800 [Hibiscus trionum]|uniref:Uncharacterized protein n=1 Tax=Hibiscus trionum TaxID=183268 RepID=A0A9W7IG45_HIBTR|nr:hypothetical protein HRI_003231800 [Hibiscus trionum]